MHNSTARHILDKSPSLSPGPLPALPAVGRFDSSRSESLVMDSRSSELKGETECISAVLFTPTGFGFRTPSGPSVAPPKTQESVFNHPVSFLGTTYRRGASPFFVSSSKCLTFEVFEGGFASSVFRCSSAWIYASNPELRSYTG